MGWLLRSPASWERTERWLEEKFVSGWNLLGERSEPWGERVEKASAGAVSFSTSAADSSPWESAFWAGC